jgi:serine/threonine-protein kinase
MNNLAQAYDHAGRLAEGELLWRELSQLWKKKAGADSTQYAHKLAAWGYNLLQQKKYIEAEPLLRECLAIREKKLPDHTSTYNAKSMLGASLLGQKKFVDAEPLLLQGFEGLKQHVAKDSNPQQQQRQNEVFERLTRLQAGSPDWYVLLVRLSEAAERLTQLYEATDQPEKALRWRTELEATAFKEKESRK